MVESDAEVIDKVQKIIDDCMQEVTDSVIWNSTECSESRLDDSVWLWQSQTMSSTGTPCTNLENIHCTMYENCEFHILFTVCMFVFDNLFIRKQI